MMNLSPFRRRPTDHDAALTEAAATLAEVGRTLACLAEHLIAETQALREQVELQRQRDDRIDGRLNAFEEWISRMRRTAPRFLGSDPSKAFAAFVAALASHYPPGRDPDAPFGGGGSRWHST